MLKSFRVALAFVAFVAVIAFVGIAATPISTDPATTVDRPTVGTQPDPATPDTAVDPNAPRAPVLWSPDTTEPLFSSEENNPDITPVCGICCHKSPVGRCICWVC